MKSICYTSLFITDTHTLTHNKSFSISITLSSFLLLYFSFFILFAVFTAILAAKVSVCVESWTLSWWHGNRPGRNAKQFTRCSWPVEWFGPSRYPMLLYIGAIYRCQIRCARTKNWQQLQSIHVSGINLFAIIFFLKFYFNGSRIPSNKEKFKVRIVHTHMTHATGLFLRVRRKMISI